MPGVVDVIPKMIHKLHTTRSWDYLGLSFSHATNNPYPKSNKGDGIIVGVIDSGIWPESKSFHDQGLGPIPSRWKGECMGGDQFKSTHCNRKLIGARWFAKGAEDEINTTEAIEYLSPRDAVGHGTHTASTAVGSLVHDVSFKGLGLGTARGGAPRARLAVYKACWNLPGNPGGCSNVDEFKAVDEAIHDGVDVLSLSIGGTAPITDPGLDIILLHAVAKGITVVCAAGNDGPHLDTVDHVAPWIISVAASTMDRSFPSPIMLGNNRTIMPDVAAPGVNVLAAYVPKEENSYQSFAFDSGSSMACPHVSGIVVLLKVLHPNWSPAAIRSALATTASATDPLGEPIFTVEDPQKVANPFHFGSGVVNPNRAANPGLIYDMGMTDYIHYLCSIGYSESYMRSTVCPTKKPSILNLNLPSITIPNLSGSVTVTRTVTNVGPVDSTYVASIEHPLGVKVGVKPPKLAFNSTIKTLSFTVTLSSNHKAIGGYYFGRLSWSDGIHKVTSPISVRTEIIPSYTDGA